MNMRIALHCSLGALHSCWRRSSDGLTLHSSCCGMGRTFGLLRMYVARYQWVVLQYDDMCCLTMIVIVPLFQEGITPLLAACKSGKCEVARWLISHCGVDPNEASVRFLVLCKSARGDLDFEYASCSAHNFLPKSLCVVCVLCCVCVGEGRAACGGGV